MASATTHDAIFGGKLVLEQPARDAGYRVNADAILLARFAATAGDAGPRRSPRRWRAALDLGAGVGAVGLSLLHLDAVAHVTLIEVDPFVAELADRNVRANGWAARASVVTADVAEVGRGMVTAADLVVCNPPYVAPGRGRTPKAARARARAGPLDTFLDAARRLAGRRARVCLVYPANEATTLLSALRARGLEPKRIQAVHGRSDAPARVLLVECAAGRPGGLAIVPPLFETAR